MLQATAAGVKETEATNMLEKKFRSGPQYSRKEVIELAISVLQVGMLQLATCCAGSGAALAHESAGLSSSSLSCCACSLAMPLHRVLTCWRASCVVLQHVLGEDLKASDIEVGVASAADGGRFRVLSSAELDEHLVAISERD